MIRTKAQLQAAEKALSKTQMKILQEMRNGAYIKLYESKFLLIQSGSKSTRTVLQPTIKKLSKLGFLEPKYDWRFGDEEYFLRDLTWIKE